MDINSTKTLNNGIKMPILGFGTWKLGKGDEAKQAVLWALEAGYRHIDTAAYYGNESSVGEAIQESGVPREEIFVTTKLWNSDHDNPRGALEASLSKLGMDYVDQYLIHWPVPPRNQTWKEFEKFYDEGLCKTIGVSNFSIEEIKELLGLANVKPAVNQIEFNPVAYKPELLDYCQSEDIAIVAYSPLRHAELVDNPVAHGIGNTHSKTPSQVLIRWSLQHGAIVIPKSSHQERIKENAEVFDFELSEEEMEQLNGLKGLE